MKWLQWSTVDLENGLGGVEVHARSLRKALMKLGIDCELSSNPEDLKKDWDVIQTHGSSAPLHLQGQIKGKPIRVHTLHGTTLGRMKACREWLWPGGYQACAKEISGVLQSDVILGVHPRLWLFKLAEKLNKTTVVASNGWDNGLGVREMDPLPPLIERRLITAKPFWVFVGRSLDPVKGGACLKSVTKILPRIHWVAAPGEGFENNPAIIRTGPLQTAQIQSLLSLSSGLLLPSLYEGLSLVLLEALAAGIPVVATPVGGVKSVPPNVKGLIVASSTKPWDVAFSLKAAEKLSNSPEARLHRAEWNQRILSTWSQVAQRAVEAVHYAKGKKARAR